MLLNILVSLLVITAAFAIAAKVVRGVTIKGGVVPHLAVATIFSVLLFAFGFCLKSILVITTFGLLWWLSNVANFIVVTILVIATDKFTDKLTITSLGSAALVGLIVCLAQFVMSGWIAPALG